MRETHTEPQDWQSTDPDDGGFAAPERRRWDGGRAILFFVLTAFASMLLGVALFVPLGFYGSVVIAEALAFGAIPMAVCALFATGWRQWTAKSRMGSGAWVWAILCVLSFAVAQSNLPVLFDRVYPIPSTQLQMFKEYLTAQTPYEFLRLLAVAALIPALFEEFAFRGVIQAGLRDTYGPRHAVIWTGFLFALLHLNPWNFLGLWSFGCLLGYLVERTGSIRPAILLHMLNNTMALIVFSVQGRDQWDERPEFIPWYWTLLAGAVLIMSIRELHRLTSDEARGTGPVSAPHAIGATDPFDHPPVR